MNYPMKRLLKIQESLWKFCHVQGCKQFDNCPDHCACKDARKRPLDTITAIAWHVASELVGDIENSMDSIITELPYARKFTKSAMKRKKKIVNSKQTRKYALDETDDNMRWLQQNRQTLFAMRMILGYHKRSDNKIFRLHALLAKLELLADDFYYRMYEVLIKLKGKYKNDFPNES